MDLLDKEWFRCCVCKKVFRHTEGTWLPVEPLQYTYGGIELLDNNNGEIEPRMPGIPVLVFDLREPVVVMSEDFTCYGCCE